MRRFFIILFVSTLTAACAKELPRNEEPLSDGTVFIGSSELPKVTIAEQSGTQTLVWESADAISIYDETLHSLLTTAQLTAGANTPTGTFTAKDKLPEGSTVRILYPASESYEGRHTVPTVQNQEAGGERALAQYTFAYSEPVTIGQGPQNFSLSHVPAYFRIRISSNGYAGYKLSSLTLRSVGAKLSGEYEYDFASKEIRNLADHADSVQINLTTPLTISTSLQDIWFCVLPWDLEGAFIEVKLYMTTQTGSNFAKSVKFTGRRLESGKLYSLKITNPTINWYEYPDKTLSEYSTQKIRWKKNGASSYSNKTGKPAQGMNWMKRVRSGYNAQDSWGGAAGLKPDYLVSTNPEGFWRVGKLGGRTVMVDPDGNVALLAGMNNVSPEAFSEASNAVSVANYNARWSTDEDWARETGVWLKQAGINMYSANAARIAYYREKEDKTGRMHYNSPAVEQLLQHPDESTDISQCEILFLLRTFYYEYAKIHYNSKAPGTEMPMVALCFDPFWLEYLDKTAKVCADYFKDNPNFLGYYTDNELPFENASSSSFTTKVTSLANFLAVDTPEKLADAPMFWQYAVDWAKQWMQDNYGTTVYSASMEDSFKKDVYEYYYRTCSEALRRNDPNHLVMGSRLNGDNRNSPILMAACAKYCDIVSINYYGHNFEAVQSDFDNFRSWIGETPYLISEMYVKGMDVQTANEGGGDMVETQGDRGRWYNNYCRSLVQVGNCAGWQWFKWWNDWNTAGSGWVNKGIMKSDCSGPYTDVTEEMLNFGRNAAQVLQYYTDHEAGSNDYPGTLINAEWY